MQSFVFVRFETLLCESKRETRGPSDDRHHVKMAKKQKCHQKAHSALLLMETRLLTSFSFTIFAHHTERERAGDGRQKNPNAETSLLP